MRTLVIFVLMAMGLAGCGAGGAAVETRVQIEKVPVRVPCPSPEVYAKLVRTQPVPLVTQKMPATADERVARQSAQLGLYEAKGGWADRARAALDRCQAGEDLTP